MHFEILVEDSSGTRLIEHLMPNLIGARDEPHSWRLHSYRGIGRIPKSLDKEPHAAQRLLLGKLPALLRGYVKTPGYDAVIVVCDTNARNCNEFPQELRDVANNRGAEAITMFRLAIEEIEAWYFGDRQALLKAYPQAKKAVLDAYMQDSVCDTWERLADCVHPGGSRAIMKSG